MHTQIKSSGPLGTPNKLSHRGCVCVCGGGGDSTNHNTAVLLCGWDVVRNIYLLIRVESIMWFELLLLSFCPLFLNLTLLTTLTTASPLTWCCIKSCQNCQNLKWYCTLLSDPTELDTCAVKQLPVKQQNKPLWGNWRGVYCGDFILFFYNYTEQSCKNWGH